MHEPQLVQILTRRRAIFCSGKDGIKARNHEEQNAKKYTKNCVESKGAKGIPLMGLIINFFSLKLLTSSKNSTKKFNDPHL